MWALFINLEGRMASLSRSQDRTSACPDVSRYPGKVVVASSLLGDQLGVVFSFSLRDRTIQAKWGNKVS